MFRSFDWDNRRVSINGDKVSNLRFADDVTIIAHDPIEVELSLNELSVASMQDKVLGLLWQNMYFVTSVSLKD